MSTNYVGNQRNLLLMILLSKPFLGFCKYGLINFSNILDFFFRGLGLHKLFFWRFRNHSVCFLSRGKLWLKFLASHLWRIRFSFPRPIFTQWIPHVEIKLNLRRNATGLPGEILKCNSLCLKFFEIDTLYSRKIALNLRGLTVDVNKWVRIRQPAEYVSDEIIVHRGAFESCVWMTGTLAILISPWQLTHLT